VQRYDCDSVASARRRSTFAAHVCSTGKQGVYENDKGQRQDDSPRVLDIESKTDLCTVIKVLTAP
jgi:hypothetical protein